MKLDPSLRIRLATAADAPCLASLRVLRRGSPPQALAWAKRGVERSSRANPTYRLLVAEREGEVLGYGVATRFKPPEGSPENVAPAGLYLMGLIVHPEHRRQGAGAALVASRLDWIYEQDELAYYFGDDANTATVALHNSFGFQPVTQDFWVPGLADPDEPMTLYRLERSNRT